MMPFSARAFLLFTVLTTPLKAVEPVPFVDLDKDRSLAGLFKAGLRPWQVWGLENRDCEIRPPVVASFKVAGITLPPLNAAWEFSFNGRTLVKVKGIAENALSVEEAYAVTAPMEQAFGGDPAAMLKWMQGYPQTSTNGEMWSRKVRTEKMSAAWYFRHSFNDTRPFLLTILIQWYFEPVDIVRSSEPLQPPPGFEDFDMRPANARTMDGPDGRRLPHRSPPAPASAPGRVEPSRENASAKDEAAGHVSSWLWLLLLIPLLTGAGIYWRLQHPRRASSQSK